MGHQTCGIYNYRKAVLPKWEPMCTVGNKVTDAPCTGRSDGKNSHSKKKKKKLKLSKHPQDSFS